MVSSGNQNRTKAAQENSRPVSLMNIDAKVHKVSTSRLNPAAHKKDNVP